MALALVVTSLLILSALGVGLLAIAFGARHLASATKAECASLLAAEAGYEKAVFWMCQQQDMLSSLHQGVSGTTGALTFPDSSCTYQISLYTFVGSRPVFRVVSLGHSGVFARTVDVFVIQAVSGWDMGMCRIPCAATATTEVYFATGETIDMPVHINKADDSPDVRDLNISGTPSFLQSVSLSESRTTQGGADKYGDVLSLFSGGIYFDQPNTRITDEASIQLKVDRFHTSTKAQYCFTPVGTAAVTDPHSATQIEFFEEGGVGKARITNNCTVRTFQQDDDAKTYDFKILPGTNGQQYERYGVYAYHVAPANADATGERKVVLVSDTYVTQTFNGVSSAEGGQIFVNGDVVLGGDLTLHANDQVLKGKVTIVSTGNIWIADSVYAQGTHDAEGQPTADNPNVLGLVAQGVIKVADPGLSTLDSVTHGTGFVYVPIGVPDRAGAVQGDPDYKQRHLPAPTVVEAAIAVGGGGWGAENVRRGSYGGRKQVGAVQDMLRVNGSIAEAVRGVVGVIGQNGYLKAYTMDRRLLGGIVPGDIGLRGKYVPAPAGWHDFRPSLQNP
jgi:hypothetical protein